MPDAHPPIRLPKTQELTFAGGVQLVDDLRLQYQRITKTSLSGQQAIDVTIDWSEWDHCNLQETSIQRLLMRHTKLVSCDLANCAFETSIFDEVECASCKFSGSKLQELEFKNGRLIECKADYIQLTRSIGRYVVFDHCNLQNAYFDEADLRNIIFTGCDLTAADFSNAKLRNIDLRGSVIERIRLNHDQFSALTVDPSQALYLMRYTGITIEA